MANNRNHNGSHNGIAKLKYDAIRFFKNGHTTIRKVNINHKSRIYLDDKPIREGCGIMYLGMLKAIDAFALTRPGYSEDNLPDNENKYIELLSGHAVHNGKLKKAFIHAYTILHVAAYYRGETNVETIKEGIANARFVIEKLTGKRVS